MQGGFFVQKPIARVKIEDDYHIASLNDSESLDKHQRNIF